MHCYNVNELHCLKFNCVTREDFKNNQWPFTNSNYNDCICTKIFKPVKCNGKTYIQIYVKQSVMVKLKEIVWILFYVVIKLKEIVWK